MTDWTKPVQTLDGRPCRVLCIDTDIGAVKDYIIVLVKKKNGPGFQEHMFHADSEQAKQFKNVERDMYGENIINWDKPLITADGKSVRLICRDRKTCGDEQYYVVLIDDGDQGEYVMYVNQYGHSRRDSTIITNKKIKREGWTNISTYNIIYQSEDAAKAAASPYTLDTVKVEWEE